MMNYVFHLILCRVEGGELFDKVVSISQYDELRFHLILCRVEGGELFYKVVSISQYDELCFPLNSL